MSALASVFLGHAHDKDLGSIEPGKLADLVVLDSNPLENIRNSDSVRYTVLNGVVYDSNMDQIAGGSRRRQPFWFEQSAGGAYTAGVVDLISGGD